MSSNTIAHSSPTDGATGNALAPTTPTDPTDPTDLVGLVEVLGHDDWCDYDEKGGCQPGAFGCSVWSRARKLLASDWARTRLNVAPDRSTSPAPVTIEPVLAALSAMRRVTTHPRALVYADDVVAILGAPDDELAARDAEVWERGHTAPPTAPNPHLP